MRAYPAVMSGVSQALTSGTAATRSAWVISPRSASIARSAAFFTTFSRSQPT